MKRMILWFGAVVLILAVRPWINAEAHLPGDNEAGEGLRANTDRIEKRILALAEFGKNPEGGVSRVAFSQADIDGRDYIMSLMKHAGLDVRIDAAGNILGRRNGRNPNLPPILFGSHIDSVPGGGNYDGDVGVMGSLECMQVLHENQFMTEHPLEMVVFSDEEGGLVGSRAMIGKLTAEALKVVSHSGKTIEEGIRAIGGDPVRLAEAQSRPGEYKAFIELHIEQGSILDDKGIDIGVVEGIVGIDWWDVTIEGFANHAGTTPMNKRQDAMLAAAHLTVAVNEIITGEPGRQVGTVGRIKAEPGAPNVIPGKVVHSLEIRDLSREKIWTLFEKIKTEAKEIEKKTDTRISFKHIDVAAIPAAIDLLDRRRIDPAAMVTDVVGFAAFADAFQALKTPSTQCKVLLEPNQTGDSI